MNFLKDKTLTKVLSFTLIGIALYAFLSVKFDTFSVPKAKISDIYTRLIVKLKPAPACLDDILILGMDSESTYYLNTRWPWKRSITAILLNKLNTFSPKVVFFDAIFSGETEILEDIALEKALKNSGNILIASYINENGQYIIPEPIFAKAALGFGLVNKPRERDLVVRRARTVILSKDEEVLDYSLALKTFCVLKESSIGNISFDKDKKIITIPQEKEDIIIPLLEDRTLDLNYSFSPGGLKFIPAWHIFKEDIDPNEFKDKIIFIGATSEISHDTCHTPFGVLPGVIVNAYETVNFIESAFMSRLPFHYELLILLFLVGVISFLSYKFSLKKGLLFFFGVILLYVLFCLIATFYDIKVDGFGILFLGLTAYISINFYKQFRLLVEIVSLKQLAITDGLTGVYVRRYFDLRLQHSVDRSLRYKENFSLIILDIDFFKKVNDTYGHLAGDLILKELSRILKKISRNVDIVCRYGGEEFAIILPQTDTTGAEIFAKRILSAVSDFPFKYKDKIIRATVSIGIATFSQISPQTPKNLISVADSYLYKAKDQGRNRVVTN